MLLGQPRSALDIFDVEIPGYNNDPIKGWFLTPKGLVEVVRSF